MTKGAKRLNHSIQHIKVQQFGFVTGKKVIDRLPGYSSPIRQVNLARNRLAFRRGFDCFSFSHLPDIFFDFDAHGHATSVMIYRDYSLKYEICQLLLRKMTKVIDITVKNCYTLLQDSRIEKSGVGSARFGQSVQMKTHTFACRRDVRLQKDIMMIATSFAILPRSESWRKLNLKISQIIPNPICESPGGGSDQPVPAGDSPVASDLRTSRGGASILRCFLSRSSVVPLAPAVYVAGASGLTCQGGAL